MKAAYVFFAGLLVACTGIWSLVVFYLLLAGVL